MRKRQYYSIRIGKNPNTGSIDLVTFKRLFTPIYQYFENEGYFQEFFGFTCVDAGYSPGKLGSDIEAALIIHLRKANIWPINEKMATYSEDDFFDMLEFLFDHCSKPTERYYHNFSECGWHCSNFNKELGAQEFRDKVNQLLEIYGNGYEMSPSGEILILPEPGLEELLESPLPVIDPENIEARVQAARTKFRRSRVSLDERREAIRDLADVLEYLRPKLKSVLISADENDLFNLANNFGIRHHNQNQKTDYDKPIWYSWLFYYYLATIHASLRLIAKAKTG